MSFYRQQVVCNFDKLVVIYKHTLYTRTHARTHTDTHGTHTRDWQDMMRLVLLFDCGTCGCQGRAPGRTGAPGGGVLMTFSFDINWYMCLWRASWIAPSVPITPPPGIRTPPPDPISTRVAHTTGLPSGGTTANHNRTTSQFTAPNEGGGGGVQRVRFPR